MSQQGTLLMHIEVMVHQDCFLSRPFQQKCFVALAVLLHGVFPLCKSLAYEGLRWNSHMIWKTRKNPVLNLFSRWCLDDVSVFVAPQKSVVSSLMPLHSIKVHLSTPTFYLTSFSSEVNVVNIVRAKRFKIENVAKKENG